MCVGSPAAAAAPFISSLRRVVVRIVAIVSRQLRYANQTYSCGVCNAMHVALRLHPGFGRGRGRNRAVFMSATIFS